MTSVDGVVSKTAEEPEGLGGIDRREASVKLFVKAGCKALEAANDSFCVRNSSYSRGEKVMEMPQHEAMVAMTCRTVIVDRSPIRSFPLSQRVIEFRKIPAGDLPCEVEGFDGLRHRLRHHVTAPNGVLNVSW